MVDIELPGLGSGLSEGELVAWTVEPGDRVAAEDTIAEVETEKSVVDVPAPVAGTVAALRAEVGDTVATGDVIAEIDAEEAEGAEADETGEAPDAAETTADETEEGTGPPAPETPTPEGRVFAPPRVRRIARERGIDIGSVEGSGPSGRITEDDVLSASEASEDERSESSDESEDRQLKSAVSRVGDDDEGDDGDERALKSAVSRVGDDDEGDERALKSAVSRVGDDDEEDERELKSAVSRVSDEDEAIEDEAGDRELKSAVSRVGGGDGEASDESEPEATESQTREETDAAVDGSESGETAGQAAPDRPAAATRGVVQATHHDLAVVPELVAARDRLEPLAEKRGVDLTSLPFLVKSVAAALRDHPELNARFDEETGEVVPGETYHVGVAPATGDRDVFVVRDVDEKSILEVATAIAEGERGEGERGDPRDGGITVTDVGAVGGEYVTPAVETGQVAALGVGTLQNRAVVEDDAVVSRPTLPLSVAVDRRAVDLGRAVAFTNALAEYLADPTLLLLE